MDEFVKLWLRKLEDVAYDADNVLDMKICVIWYQMKDKPLITETDSIVPDTVVGKQNDKLKLVNMLIKPSNDAVSVIPIVGMGAWKDNFSSFNLQSSSRRKAFRWKDLD
ncbi:Hypothetical predicted protein [Olea europaea subsp. europaea]|uniref:Rx N-terminal domain-containing protein n=1 Tax=Olea europaea subsp. europaea TaxID=158383 RepID=A0A8S0U4G3_OLEEU|nr:Hypothetical predicted protein [Olea europaea subsp. europaea]